MATYNDGIMGGFSGKVGPVVGATWRNKHVLRSLPGKSTKPPSEKQLQYRSKFGLVSSFLTPLGGLIKKTFTYQFGCETRRGASISYYNKYVAKSGENGYVIDYPKMMVSTGVLRGLQQPTLQLETPHTLLLKWQDNSAQGMAASQELLSVVFYAPELHEFYFVEFIAQRADEHVNIALPDGLQEHVLHAWAFFAEVSTKNEILQVSNSDYIGAILI